MPKGRVAVLSTDPPLVIDIDLDLDLDLDLD
jgi:hypothetical protein